MPGSPSERLRTWRSTRGGLPLPTGLKDAYRRWLVDEFATYYYESGPWQRTSWLGVPTKQCPGDLVVLQQILVETRPEIIVETGTFYGGTALFFGHIFDALGEGEIVTIDIDHAPVEERVRRHPRVQLLTADSTLAETKQRIQEIVGGRRAMLYLDADHNSAAVLAELRGYADLVAPGCYAVVADSIMGGHPVPWPYRGQTYSGPWDAVAEFLRERDDFEVDEDREHHLLTFNPRGYLRRRI